MAVPVIKSAAHIPGAAQLFQGPRTLDFLLSEANSYRSREVMQVPQAPPPGLWPGTFVDATGAPAATAAAIVGILAYATNPVDGPYNQTVIVRDAEVIDAYLIYGALDPVAVNAQLATRNVIVRAAVLPNTRQGSFGMDIPLTDPPLTGITAPVMADESQPPSEPPADQSPAAPKPLPTGGN